MMGTTGRGSTMEVGFYIEKVLASEVSGNIIDLCPVGALTSKPYSFTARPWELKSYNSIDLFDAIGSNIRVDVRGSNIMRILPRINASLNEDWISDKVRFAYDGLKAQRLLSPFAKVDGSLVKVSWQKAFYFIRHFFFTALDTKHSSKFRTQGIVGNFIDAEAMVAFKDLFNRLGSSNYTFAQDNSSYDNTFRQSYLFNTPISQVESADVCLLIATNPRLEAPTLNIKLRKLFLSNVSIYNLGFYSTLNYYTKHLGNNLNVLIKVLEGNHWFCQKLLLAQNPLVIIGSSFFQRMDNLYKLLPLLQRLLLNNSSIRASGNSNFFNINHLPWASNTVTALDLNLKSSNYFRTKLPADFIYLLGADDIASPILKSTDGLCVYQGHHGDQSVSKADIILPSITYFEKDSTYSSIEGSPLQTKAIFYNLGKARNDWKILRALAEVLDVSLVFSSKKELHQRLVNLIPYYKHNWVANTHFDYLVKKLFSKNSVVASYCTTPFASYVNNFYLNDSISRASKTMSLCSSSYNLRGRFF